MTWDPSKHPRKPAGSSQGGEFAPGSHAELRSTGATVRVVGTEADGRIKVEFSPGARAVYPKSYLRKATWLKVDPKSAANAYKGVTLGPRRAGLVHPEDYQTHLKRTRGFD